jgi:uncharacterized membrane protein
MLWRALSSGHRTTWKSLTGLLMVGWGGFNVVEGVVNHQLLGIHHVRDDLGGPVSWDLGFLAISLLLVVAGLALRRADVRSNDASARHRVA